MEKTTYTLVHRYYTWSRPPVRVYRGTLLGAKRAAERMRREYGCGRVHVYQGDWTADANGDMLAAEVWYTK